MRWEWALFRVATTTGPKHVYGSVWGHWGVARSAEKWYVVTHLPSGCRLTQFETLRIARRYCEAIDGLTDWSTLAPPAEDLQRGLLLHRAALRVTGGRPALQVIDGGAP
jgi:hypothetical protein